MDSEKIPQGKPMTLDPVKKKLKALPVQLIETNNGVILKRGCTELKVSGDGAPEAVRLVLAATATNGGASMQEISQLFAAPSRPFIDQLIEQLLARKLLVPIDAAEHGSEVPESSLDIFYWQFGTSAARVTGHLNNHHLLILGVNCISRQLAVALTLSGMENFQVVDDPLLRNIRLFHDAGILKPEQWPASSKQPLAYQEWAKEVEPKSFDCVVATSDFGGQALISEWNTFCVQNNRHFLPIVLHNLIGYVGPLVIPGETACFQCLRDRQNSHLEDPQTTRAPEGLAFDGQTVIGFHPSMASILADIAVIELTKFYSGALPMRKVGTLIEVNLLAPRLTARKVLKIPRCHVCSPLNMRSSTTTNKEFFAPANQSRA